jgi:hypothetical protein
VPLWDYVVSGNKDILDPIGDVLNVPEFFALSQLFHEFWGIEAFLFGHFLKGGIDLYQLFTIQDVPSIAESKEGFNAARAASDYA